MSRSTLGMRKDAMYVIRCIRKAQKALAATSLFTAEDFNALNGKKRSIEDLLGRTVLFDTLNEDEVVALRREITDKLSKNLDEAYEALKVSTNSIFNNVSVGCESQVTEVVDAAKIADLKDVDDVISKLELENTAEMCEAIADFYDQYVEPAATSIKDDDKNGDGDDTEYDGNEPDEDGDNPEKGEGNEPNEDDGDDDADDGDDDTDEEDAGEVVPGTDKSLKRAAKDLMLPEAMTYIQGDVSRGEWTAENWKPAVEAYLASAKKLNDTLAKTRELLDTTAFTEEDFMKVRDSFIKPMNKVAKVVRAVCDRVAICNDFINRVNKALA